MLEVITVTNKIPEQSYYCFSQFHESLERYGFKALMLGFGEPWGGLMTKPRRLRNYLRNGDCRADVIAVCDSWDSVWQKSPAHCEKEFLELGIDILIGTEKNCFPDAALAEKHPLCASSFRYVNTGMIVAKPAKLLEFLESMELEGVPDDGEDKDNWHPNDQHYVMVEFLKRRHNTILDTETKFVANLCGVGLDEVEWKNGLISLKETGNSPYVLHCNGPAKTSGHREVILEKLRLPI